MFGKNLSTGSDCVGGETNGKSDAPGDGNSGGSPATAVAGESKVTRCCGKWRKAWNFVVLETEDDS
jgi:hypothetical protein